LLEVPAGGGITNVVATGSGSIDLTDLTGFTGTGSIGAGITPTQPLFIIGSPSGSFAYYEFISGPTSFGSGSGAGASTTSGEQVGINCCDDLGGPALGVDLFYSSGSPISNAATYDNATFTSLGVTPGTYVWTWGTGAHADSFTLQIGPVANIPEPASLPLLAVGLAGLGLVLRRRV
jgi:hypothetical protein